MPIYEFECSACGERFDRLQKLSDPDPAACPQCGKAQVRRCVTAPSFRLAGSGWYETDFKKEGDKQRHLASKDDAGKPAASESKSSSEAPPPAPAAATDTSKSKSADGKAKGEMAKKSNEPAKPSAAAK